MKAPFKGKERRHYPRLRIPIQLRPTSVLGREIRVQDISLGGIRISSQKCIDRGKTHKIEMALADGSWTAAYIQVVWIMKLPSEPALRYDMGCEFIDLPKETKSALREFISSAPQESD